MNQPNRPGEKDNPAHQPGQNPGQGQRDPSQRPGEFPDEGKRDQGKKPGQFGDKPGSMKV